uniref:AAA family ATPase n=1 Tax=candidate division WOR-3 bacterium TaxID=2052148 RepID=A0A7C4U7P4_UNCW3
MIAFYVFIGILLFILAIFGIFFSLKEMERRKKMIYNGIALSFIGILILMSFVSYIIDFEISNNLFGSIGGFLSRFFFNAFGYTFFFIPLLIIISGIGLIKNDVKKYILRIGSIISGIFIITFMTLGYFTNERFAGYIGFKLGEFIVSKIGHLGSFLLSFFLLFSLFFINFELGRFFRKKEEDKIPETPIEKEENKTEENIVEEKKKKKVERIKEITQQEIPKISGYKEKFLSFLQEPIKGLEEDRTFLEEKRILLEEKLKDLGIEGKVKNILVGPVVIRFEYKPSSNIKISKISSLSDDIAMALKAEKLRVLAPIPGKEVVGIEIPRKNRDTVYLKELLTDQNFLKNQSVLFVPIGKDITGNPYFAEIGEMPHLLVAGATGSGKSVFINSLITSILFKSLPQDTRFIMIDPKRIELSIYNGIPHLISPVITETDHAVRVLKQSLNCMEVRYAEFAKVGVRDIYGYNSKMREKMPFVLIVIDELADLLLQRGKEVENALVRLAQKSRAVGIHLILATQRPSVDVITGLIKANFPSRIAFQVASRHDAKTIMDNTGAEKLLGKGDMLFIPPKSGIPIRLHGPSITTEETKNIVKLIGGAYLEQLLKKRFEKSDRIIELILEEEMLDVISEPSLPGGEERLNDFAILLEKETGINKDEFIEFIESLEYYPTLPEFEMPIKEEIKQEETGKELDELFEEAKRIVIQHRTASASLLQRKLNIGYNRAARLIDQLEAMGIVGPFKGSKSRDVLIKE